MALKYRIFRKTVETKYLICKIAQQELQINGDSKVSIDISFGCKRLMKLKPWIIKNSRESYDRYMRTNEFNALKGRNTSMLFIEFKALP